MKEYRSIEWVNGAVRLLDQRYLPHETRYVDYTNYHDLAMAIRDMVIRGAPAVGVAAAYGLALAAQASHADSLESFSREMEEAAEVLRLSRPTAVNLQWALERVLLRAKQTSSVKEARQEILKEAWSIAEEDILINQKIGLNGVSLIPNPANIIHHCNTGALATVGYGTALGIIRCAFERGHCIHVYVDETRPRLQGARLTTWELQQLGIPHTVIVDGASGYLMKAGKVDLCLVGCDRIAANGDTANKIGTYNLALAAYAHRIPFYVAGPTSTVDLSTKTGEDIPIEMRDAKEVTHLGEYQITPANCTALNPAFDVTPGQYISAIITENGIATPPYDVSLPKLIK